MYIEYTECRQVGNKTLHTVLIMLQYNIWSAYIRMPEAALVLEPTRLGRAKDLQEVHSMESSLIYRVGSTGTYICVCTGTVHAAHMHAWHACVRPRISLLLLDSAIMPIGGSFKIDRSNSNLYCYIVQPNQQSLEFQELPRLSQIVSYTVYCYCFEYNI